MKNLIKHSVLLFVILILCALNCNAQSDSLSRIDDIVKRIKAEKNHVTREFETTEIYGESFSADGGGIIKVKSTYSEPTIIKQDLFVSRGRITTIIYLEKLKPVQIINIEELFKEKQDGTGLDYTKLNLSFKETMYILDWKNFRVKSIREGTKVLTSDLIKTDYDRLIDSVKKLVAK